MPFTSVGWDSLFNFVISNQMEVVKSFAKFTSLTVPEKDRVPNI